MRRAAAFVLEQIQLRWPAAQQLCIYAGAGNNGGDGYWLAMLANDLGFHCEVVPLVDSARLTGDAADACRQWQKQSRRSFARGNRVIVDALFGTGLARPVEGSFREAIEAINASPWPVISIDLPSGLEANTGNVLGVAVKADVTAAVVALKAGHFLGQASDYAGQVVVDKLGIPEAAYASQTPTLLTLPAPEFSPRSGEAHKGSFGHVVVIGGGVGMPGAARLAASAALRSGAGQVSVICAPENTAVMVGSQPELMVPVLRGAQAIKEHLKSADAIIVGPGLGLSAWARECFAAALSADCALVVDADALSLLAKKPQRRGNWILTPHPGEAGRLLGRAASEVQLDRLGSVHALSERFDASVVLKGHRSLVASPGSTALVALSGNPGMATAGSGDVLAGITGGLLAQGHSCARALMAAVYVHNRAGDRAAARHGQRGMLAGDLLTQMTAC